MGLKKTATISTETKVFIYPYKDVERFPVYRDDQGNKIIIPEEWRDIGFRVLRPTISVVDKLDKYATVAKRSFDEQGSAFIYYEKDVEKIVEYCVEKLIDGWEGVEDEEGKPAPYDPEWLRFQFDNFPFLWQKFYNHYLGFSVEEAAKIKKSKKSSSKMQKSS